MHDLLPSSTSALTCHSLVNGPKSWQLGWYKNKHVTVDISATQCWEGDLFGIVDYGSETATNVIVEILGSADPWYVSFNRRASFNSGTNEGSDTVLVHKTVESIWNGLPYARPSLLMAKLSALDSYNSDGVPLPITVTSINTSEWQWGSQNHGYAHVKIGACPGSTPPPTPQPTPQPLCPSSSSLLGPYIAGYTCYSDQGAWLGDSTIGMTAGDCATVVGQWTSYSCSEANSHYQSVGGESWEHAQIFAPGWTNKCCSSDAHNGLLTSTADIGYVGIGGTTTYDAATGKTTLTASGGDIWGTSDGFRYAYQTLEGDFAIWARVHNPSRSHEWVKSGLMVRDTLNSNSANVGLFFTGDHGLLAQYRPWAGASSAGVHADFVDRTTPVWIAITRSSGRYFDYYMSEDAVVWTKIGSTVEVEMGNTVHIGVAATSHNNGALTAASSQWFGYQEY